MIRFAPWRWPAPIGLAVCLATAALLSVLLRQDANWDLQNYHLYNGWAMLQGGRAADLYVAGIQTYLNPLLDVPYAAVALFLLPSHPIIVAALAGLPAGVLAWIVCRLCGAIARAAGAPPSLAAAMALIGLTGSTAVAEIGTTFNDISVAVLAVAALWSLLSAPRAPASIAGLLLGLAAGLKITALIFAPAGLAAALLAIHSHRLRAAFGFCAAWALGALAADGWNAWALWHSFGNPLFPLLNSVFASPWAGPGSGQDLRFLPHSWLQALFFPFTFLAKRPFVVSEAEIRDARFAACYLALPALIFLAWRHRLPRAGIAVIGFLVTGFVVWEALFGIIRYAMPLEVLTGIPVGLALHGFARRPRWAFAIAIVLIATTNYPGYGRVRGFRSQVITVNATPLPPHTLLVLAEKPTSYLIPFLAGPDTAAIGLEEVAPGSTLETTLRARIATAASVAVIRKARSDAAMLRHFGLALEPNSCQPVENNLQTGILLCRAQAVPIPATER